MGQFNVYRLRSGTLVLDCQADVVSETVNTRFVVPLLDPDQAPLSIKSLHPLIRVHDKDLLMATQLATAVPARDLSEPVASVRTQRYIILNALDFLITGV